jgi:hypothetical protein
VFMRKDEIAAFALGAEGVPRFAGLYE